MACTTKYSEEIQAKAEAYLDGGWEKEGDSVPQIAGLALAIGVHRDTCYEWAKDADKPLFSDIFTRVQAQQERRLVNSGLSGDFNPAITKMMLTKHGYSDASKIDHTSGGEKMPPATFVFRGVNADTD